MVIGIERVVICLGTNDVSRFKYEHNIVIHSITQAVTKVKCHYSNSEIGLCTILPRKEKSPNVAKFNITAENANIFVRHMCEMEKIELIDCFDIFYKNSTILKSLFDGNDSSGLHINVDGCEKMKDLIVSFLNKDGPKLTDFKTPNKRTVSVRSGTPNSAERYTKQSKHGSPEADSECP
ncbi:unnamed protein product [Mytilus coruscus]|uniref:SGNH hydrolase-type esterase domain-containing protein n=1 Tax=Mytilus coruscus TaxID=42192 RepID=A0A6J8B9J3_MYTCO|nr:unnamed protein product [Mytilus coruscus]